MTIADVITKTTNEFLKWLHYTEKTKLSALTSRDYNNPGDYNEYAGSNNYTIFAKYYLEKTGINVQGQPWCDTFIDTIFIHLFGVDIAKKMLGGFSAYTPTSANYFKKMNRWFTTPKAGDIIFFKNSERIYHTGYVYRVSDSYVYTVEGNTSTTNNTVEENGGCVATKYYLKSNSKIAGYGRPDYSLAITPEETYVEGWMRAADGKRWWYQFSDGRYALNNGVNDGWYIINNRYYMFDTAGYMLTGIQKSGEFTYYLNESTDSEEGALMSSYGNDWGGLTPWDLSKYSRDELKKMFP